ncbi:hypothetical protein QAD02_016565 [Eretmocerus hayati]|uniref:Uncharacterized protein n=1 Tax=Eretmocerus hayati TaxID=131215 RepID=A0ACC2PCG0_9HYME|nr:hypothetical protein QAD02_016565 [Eretmocerus hayati]
MYLTALEIDMALNHSYQVYSDILFRRFENNPDRSVMGIIVEMTPPRILRNCAMILKFKLQILTASFQIGVMIFNDDIPRLEGYLRIGQRVQISPFFVRRNACFGGTPYIVCTSATTIEPIWENNANV